VLLQLSKLRGVALNLLFPQWCLGCGKEGDLLCHACYLSLPRLVHPVCPRCGKPQPSGILCPSCVGWKAEIDGIRAPLRFDGLARKAIHQLKYKNLKSLAGPLSGLLQEYLDDNPIPGDILVPVPLHPRRLKERGYNQSALLARALGKSSGLPVVEDCLVRSRFQPPQARTASVIERRHNVAGAFTCRSSELTAKRVMLIDDVSTSGSTLDACASALKTGGASSVWALALARET
jgi:ComF family protein